MTSSYYPPLPALLSFNEGVPAFFAAPEHRTWALSGRIPAADLDRLTSAMDGIRDVTAQPEGYRAAFPHALDNPKAIVSSPWGDVLVLQLARFVIASQRLGSRADRPDLLFVGLSSTDYYGHWFGPDSKEIADGLVRLDASLAAFFQWLDERVGRDRVLTFLTADHGVQSLPEVTRAKKKKRPARRTTWPPAASTSPTRAMGARRRACAMSAATGSRSRRSSVTSSVTSPIPTRASRPTAPS